MITITETVLKEIKNPDSWCRFCLDLGLWFLIPTEKNKAFIKFRIEDALY